MKWKSLFGAEKIWILSDQAVVSGSAFATNMLIARSLGMAAFGEFSVLLIIQLFLLSIQQAVLTGILQVLLPAMRGKTRRRYLNGLFHAQMFALFFLLPAGWSLTHFAWRTKPELSQLYLPGMLGTFLFLLQDICRRILLTEGNGKRAFFIDSLTNSLQLAFLTGLLLTGRLTLATTCWTIGLTFLPSVLLGLYWIRPGWYVRGNIPFVYGLHKGQAGWMLPAALLQWLAGNFFVVAAGWWLGLAALGALRLAQYLFGLLNVVLQAIENYALPKAVLIKDGQTLFNSFLLQILTRSMFLVLPVLLAFSLFAKPILLLGGGQAYSAFAYVMQGLAAVYILIVAGIPVRIALRVKKLNRQYFTGYLLASLFSLLFARWLIQQWQLAGVLAGLFATQAIMLTYWIILLKQKNIIAWRSFT